MKNAQKNKGKKSNNKKLFKECNKMIIIIAMILIEKGRALKVATKNNTSIGIFETSLLKVLTQ